MCEGSRVADSPSHPPPLFKPPLFPAPRQRQRPHCRHAYALLCLCAGHARAAVALSVGYLLFDTLLCCYAEDIRDPMTFVHHSE